MPIYVYSDVFSASNGISTFLLNDLELLSPLSIGCDECKSFHGALRTSAARERSVSVLTIATSGQWYALGL